MNFAPAPVLLTGRTVRLEPLERRHLADLHEASRDPEIWTWMLSPAFASFAEVEQWFDDAMRQQAAGAEIAWATVRASDGRAVGTTRFLDIRRAHRALEIGNTWLGADARRTPINTEAKFLQLRHAFEELGAVRVQLKTDERNQRSRQAIERIGGVFEGILRNYQTRSDGYVRHTAMFSLVAADWPAARRRLESRLAGGAGAA